MRVLADDLTGALEVGAHFAQHGLRAAVVTSGYPAGFDVVVVDTETRHVTEDEAARTTAQLAAGGGLVYQKTDSTLRGNIRAQLRALSQLDPGARIAYLPAYPALGRTVKRGCLLVHGIPVHETAFARDPLNPIRESYIPALLGEDLRCTVHDGESDGDVAAALDGVLADPEYRILAGPASVSAALAARIGGPARVREWPFVGSCLVVNGSLHEASTQQIEYARQAGCLDAGWRHLRIEAPPGAAPLEVAAQTARQVRDCAAATRPDAVLIFGGDTAFAIWQAFGEPVLEPLGEVLPGVPVTRVAGSPIHWITKAGGYGDETLICRLKQVLHAK